MAAAKPIQSIQAAASAGAIERRGANKGDGGVGWFGIERKGILAMRKSKTHG